MSNIEQVIEQIRSFAGADFAFLLTRRGRLVTRGAPREMPEAGRVRLVALAEPLIGTDGIGETTLPREDLVPFGGAAPVDVYVAVAAEKAIVCAVMPTWAAKSRIISAMKAGVRALGPLIEGQEANARRRRMEVASEARSPDSRSPASKPPESRSGGQGKRTNAGLLTGSGPTTHASRNLEQSPQIKSVPPPQSPAMPPPTPAGREGSMPSITLGEATLGRESLAAIEAEQLDAEPRPPPSSMPSISVGQATLGRESVEAIEAEMQPHETSSPDEIRLELDTAPDLPPLSSSSPQSSRTTQPWVESAVDAKRAADAARAAGKNSVADEEPVDTLTWGTPIRHPAPPGTPRPGKRRR